MVRVLIFINLAGGLIALIASSVTDTPSVVTFLSRTTYILGTFQVNPMHGLMHLVVGAFGLWALSRLESSYLRAHAVCFLLIGIWGLHAFPGLAPQHTAAGLAISLPDHLAHFGLALLSAAPLLIGRSTGRAS